MADISRAGDIDVRVVDATSQVAAKVDANGSVQQRLFDSGGAALIGQKTMAASVPVVFPSDQTINTGSAYATGNIVFTTAGQQLSISTLGYQELLIHVTGTFSGTLVPFITVNGSQLTVAPVIDLTNSTIVSIITAVGKYRVPCSQTWNFQLFSSVWSSGTATVYYVAGQGVSTQNVVSWLGSRAPTIGQKTMASSLPVTIASNQSAVPVSGTITAAQSLNPTFSCIFPTAGYTTFAANAQQAIIYNNNASYYVRILKAIWLPDQTARVGALSGIWYSWRRVAPSTAPAGSAQSTYSNDTADTLPANITCFNKPATAAAGGTLETFTVFTPQPDEVKLTTLDAPTESQNFEGFGTTIYDAAWGGVSHKPITIRQNQTYEIVQTATAGTGFCRILIFFTVIPV